MLPDPWRERRGRMERGRREEKEGRERGKRGKRGEERKGKRGEVIGNSYHAYLEWKAKTDTGRCQY